MSSERNSKLPEFFQAAVDLSGAERSAYLDKVCVGDSRLRQRLEQMLRVDDEQDEMVEATASSTKSVLECPSCSRCYEGPLAVCPRDGTKLRVGYAGSLLVDGKYQVERRLGSGGMGAVYLARDMRLRRPVAIKYLYESFSARFEREARAIASMNHPHICALYDIGPNYLVMEYVEGEPLSGPLPFQDALKLALQIVEALDAAHRRNIIHRDLKPANILVTGNGQVKLVDFGIARLVDDRDAAQTLEGTVLGTCGYMAPEQAQAKPADARSDIFSFGVNLYELLSGQHPFPGTSDAEALTALLRDRPRPLGEVPAELQAVVMRCLRKNPAERYQSMAQVKEAVLSLIKAGDLPVDRTPSIAVLPFANMSRDDDEYFSDGLAEEIINALAQLRGLKVIARTSAFVFRGKEQDIRKIAKTLGVSNVLEGSVRRSGNRLRITAQLIQAADGTQLWSQRYDRDMSDVFAIQDEISHSISEALKLRLTHRTQVVNLEAYQHYLKGHYYRVRLRPESLARAKEFFDKALAIEPQYAPAYSGLAGYYWIQGAFGIRPVGEVAPLVKSAALKALAIDPANSEAHSVLAIMDAVFSYDWKAAEEHYCNAMAAEPVPPLVRFRYAVHYLCSIGRVRDAMEESRIALETDPLSMLLHFGMAWSMYLARQHEETVEYARGALEIDSNFHLGWFTIGLAQLATGAIEEAVRSFKRLLELAPWWHFSVGLLAAAHWQAGDAAQSDEWAAQLSGPMENTLGAAVYFAVTGDVDRMFEALEGAYRQRDVFVVYLQYLPMFEAYRHDTRYQMLLQGMKMAPNSVLA